MRRCSRGRRRCFCAGTAPGFPPSLHYLDNLNQFTAPLLIIAAGKLRSYFGTKFEWKFAAVGIIKSTDIVQTILAEYGHLDILTGTQAAQLVFTPMLDFIQTR